MMDVTLVLVLLDHYFFFRYFSSLPPARSHYNRFSTYSNNMSQSEIINSPTFGQMAAFFGICVWLVPFGLFVSLSAGELVLPTIGSDGRMSPGLDGRKRAQGLVKQVYATVGNWVGDSLHAFGWGGSSGGGGGSSAGYIGGYPNRY